MCDIDVFMSAQKSMIIAPAGYGKTYTIVEAVKNYNIDKKVLILTHTHAGVASIRKKLQTNEVPNSKYSLETISSFTLHFVNSYYLNKDELYPDQNNYFDLAIEIMHNFLKARPIKQIIKAKYSHLIVDEYQDCSIKQHELIVELSKLIKTHILGDPMQGIFNFNGETLVNLESYEQMNGFIYNKQILEIPWRWEKSNKILGRALKNIREKYLDKKLPIDLSLYIKYNAFELWKCKINPETGDGFYDNEIKKRLFSLLKLSTESLLILVPEKHMVNKVSKTLTSKFRVHPFEAFDEKIYYEAARKIDTATNETVLITAINLLRYLFQTEIINCWFNNKGLKRKNLNNLTNKEKLFYEQLKELTSCIKPNKERWFLNLFELFIKEYFIKCNRLERYNAIVWSIKYAIKENNTVYNGMVKNRDIARRSGRKTEGKYIGTTYLTKGLEFDTVVVLNAHLFKKAKSLYVALTRASKRLIVVSNEVVLNPKY